MLNRLLRHATATKKLSFETMLGSRMHTSLYSSALQECLEICPRQDGLGLLEGLNFLITGSLPDLEILHLKVAVLVQFAQHCNWKTARGLGLLQGLNFLVAGSLPDLEILQKNNISASSSWPPAA